MNIAIIDADLIGRTKHRFPNLACMKISSYHKAQNDNVELLLDYNNLSIYDKVYISKVFTDTYIDKSILELSNVSYGGTGFYYDESPKLPYNVEHCMPDYDLYNNYIEHCSKVSNKSQYKYYTDYSIGFLTRGCFRQCEFCVNRKYKKVEFHSSLSEFYDSNKKKICLLDDNFLGCSQWKSMLTDLQNTKKPFVFKQGLDERILTDEKCEMLFNSKYDGDYIFAFDNIADMDIIEQKAQLIRKYNKNKGQNIKFYVLCAYDRQGKYDYNFWINDIRDVFIRVFTLAKYNFKPYIMRYEKYKESPFYGTYVNLACWCNQPSLFNNLSYTQFCEKDDERKTQGAGNSATWRYYEQLLNTDCFAKYIDIIPKNCVIDYSNW